MVYKLAPSVSILIPIYGRPQFHVNCIDNIIRQTYEGKKYPLNRMEVCIVDDSPEGEDIYPYIEKYKDLLPTVNYRRLEEKIPLSQKRNLLNRMAKNDFLLPFDQDDFYVSVRIEHSVKMLENTNSFISGSSQMFMYYKGVGIYSIGPYGHNHATNATFCYKRSMLKQTQYENDKNQAEEKQFLKGYSFDMVQLDPMKIILVACHHDNTCDKLNLITSGNKMLKKTNLELKNFMSEDEAIKFNNIVSDFGIILAEKAKEKWSKFTVHEKRMIIEQNM